MWIGIGALGVVTSAVLLVALLRRPAEALDRAEHDLAVFRAQLRELEREVEGGTMGEVEAETARVEIERRMLAADTARSARAEGAAGATADGRLDGALAVAVALAVPAVALGLYLWLGAPTLGTAPVDGSPGETVAAADAPDIEAMVARLEQRLAESPDDLRGWVMLARSATVLGRYERAVEAFDRAIALKDDAAELHSGRGEVLTVMAGGRVEKEARAAFARALELDPGDVRARYYTAIAMAQDGRTRAALNALVALLEDAPADASWVSSVRERAMELAGELGIDPSSLSTDALARPPATAQTTVPKGDAAREIAAMSAADQRERIRGMVAGLARRLEDAPDDLKGWHMLARSYTVLGEAGKAERAYRRVLDLDGNNADALYRLGEAARLRGDSTEAERLWGRLLAQLAPDSADHAQLKSQIESLKGE